MAVFFFSSSRCIHLSILLLGALVTAVCAIPLPLISDEQRQVIINNHIPSLNDALTVDSDEDILFDEFWQDDEDDEDDDEDAFNFIYNLFGGVDEHDEPVKKPQQQQQQEQRMEDDIQSAMMMVSSSSDDHVIEMAIISRAKQTFRRPSLFATSSAEEQDELDLMSSDT
ncbi:hypothetical protein O0I10_001034 [Lichtheimia ornata]|uniref:Uncharacterized protein n=1 Tax=Lichtheimia ornata TaxID=688661 RepID=A0AAD7Y308_9FUNG|nr:uncharacterized protein O0I10_001034 [Lichtheimia ornata]KAJ8662858.1 hypothetical protein O0I10_001034 [Lichtheimia ornata]